MMNPLSVNSRVSMKSNFYGGGRQRLYKILENNCAYLVVGDNLPLPFGTTTHIR
jgi:hypothetical protein